MTDLPPSARRVSDAAAASGLAIAIIEMPGSTRTAQEAADACGCQVGQIVKSLVFQGARSGKPILLLVSGGNRVNEKAAAAHIGEALRRPDADYVRETTGFAIGGVPPFAHASAMDVYMDRDLFAHAEIWAAAGTPRCVFATNPQALCDTVGAVVIDVT
ncbi:YbaK/EbsC family protein [Breoghania sp. L-A4]|uniref:YbaK/EbsC family protein n=1 Tax=Breoghania sp. L-A4 TaxID=2304600 RepID=UPI000E35CD2D|nr:YbaK/EbsC family protein [Breoghania sp. L-A4]AXS41475.1 YbaK/EbsC family protein [Breoghania sp. L-A4]